MSKKKNTKIKTAPVYYEVSDDMRTLDEELHEYENSLHQRRLRTLEETILDQARHIVELRTQIQALQEWDRQDEIYRKHGA